MSRSFRTVIVGGGIWGVATAYQLARLGETDIAIVERNAEVAGETTSQAAGLIGQIRDSATMCRAVRQALDTLTRLPEETGHDPGLRRTGSLMVALTEQRMEAFADQVRRARANGVAASFVAHAEMQRLVPALEVSQVAGGYFVEGDGYVDPRQCAQALAAAARQRGVTLLVNTPVRGIVVRQGKVSGVETDSAFLAAEKVVVTAGPWTRLLGDPLGMPLPLDPLRHQAARTVPSPGIPEHHPVVRFPDVACYLRPAWGGYLYGMFETEPTPVSMEDPSFRTQDLPAPLETIAAARCRLAPLVPAVTNLAVAEFRRGVTTFTPDGRYLLGEAPGAQGLLLASGCSALGVAGAIAIGDWLAHWLRDGKPGPEAAEFAPQRFGPHGTDAEWVRRQSRHFYGNYYTLPAVPTQQPQPDTAH
jgi:4-methylaminobutanoate oxidase (formaldehyde-forming)